MQIIKDLHCKPNQAFLLVCDGHGQHGAPISQTAAKAIADKLEADIRVSDLTPKEGEEPTKGGAVQALVDACEEAEKKLHQELSTKAMYSGTTCICSMMCNDDIWTACVGDSRAVIGAVKDGKAISLDLSVDQSCSSPAEIERIRQCGGRIADFDGISRVISPNGDTVLAPTRSIGDMEFNEIGVVATPVVTHLKLTGVEQVIILASDGLWEFIPSNVAIDIALRMNDATEASDKLVRMAKKAWAEDGTYCDDITVLVAYLPLFQGQQGNHPTAMAVLSNKPHEHGGEHDVAHVTLQVDNDNKPELAIKNEHELSHPDAKDAHPTAHNYKGPEIHNPDDIKAGKLTRRATLTDVHATGSGQAKKEYMGKDKSYAPNIQGLSPNSRDSKANRAWAPEHPTSKTW